jgi:hypothetical protein
VIPLPELVAELMLGLGAALFGANLWVILRPRFVKPAKGRRAQPQPPSMTRVYVNLLIGAVIAVWGLATIISRA